MNRDLFQKYGINKVFRLNRSLPSLPLLGILLILCNCTGYQYISVSSHLSQTDSKEYVVENDTVLMRYSFAGENFPLTITIFNKLTRPLYFDMTRSTVVINGNQANNPFNVDGQIGFIAPGSHARIITTQLRDQFIDLSSADSLKTRKSTNSLGQVFSFDEGTSPVYFRTIVALTVNEDYSYPTFYDYSFWVSDVLRSSTGPKLMPYKPANQFFIKKTTGFGKAVMWISLVALVIIGGVASSGQ